ncbi:MAG: alpha/beta hydrolase [Bacteroidetes bacterium]|nr:alpha/beta hydrolase [Bacteroidota bacterium]MCY4204897.1 alpha/beta hydrolase [Bacteroidota bacterium]
MHGLLGNPEGWFDAASALADSGYRAIVPYLHIQQMPRSQANIQGIVDFVRSFTKFLDLDQIILCGNSLGGQVAIRYTTDCPGTVVALLLSGSSGIFETEVGTTTFRRHDRDYIRLKAARTFYSPKMVTDELVERIYDIATNRSSALRTIWAARSSMRDLIIDELDDLDMPTLIIWGTEDQITPPEVAHIFHELLSNSELHFIEKCGHAPMMEHPDVFNKLMLEFLNCKISKITAPV